MSDEQRDKSWDADPATPEQMQLVERVCNGLGFEGYFDTTCGWWRNEWNRPVFVPVVRSITLAYEFGRIDARESDDANEESDVPLPAGTNLSTHSAHTEVPADGYVMITTNQAGECVAVTRNDEEGRILRTLWKRFADPVPQVNPGRVFLVATGDFCDGAPTYTRHSDAPPGNMYAECLYTEPKLDCTEAAAVLEPTAPQAATVKESLQVAPDLVERVDGVLQGEWVITGPDGTTFRGATPFRAALMANRHRVQTDPVAAKQFQDVIEQGRREAEEERARLLAEHGTLNCPACGGSGYIGDALAASPASPADAEVPRLTPQQAAIVGAYTGFLCGEFSVLHKKIETLLGRPIQTHEMASKELWAQACEAAKPEFLAICAPAIDAARKEQS